MATTTTTTTVKRKQMEKFSEVLERQRKLPRLSEGIYLDSLSQNYFHLGEFNFAVVTCFKGCTRVHLRKYTADKYGGLHPTKDGVSISMPVWKKLADRMTNVWCIFEDDCIIIQKDLCVTKSEVGDKKFVCFQRMFQRKNMSLEFKPETAVLTDDEFTKLHSISQEITKSFRNVFLQDTLKHLVISELENYPKIPIPDEMGDPDLPDGWCETRDSLFKCLTNCWSDNINQLFKCFGCNNILLSQDDHECMTETLDDRFDRLHEMAFDNIDWKILAGEFVKLNHTFYYFAPLIFMYDLFECLWYDDATEECKKLYRKHNPV